MSSVLSRRDDADVVEVGQHEPGRAEQQGDERAEQDEAGAPSSGAQVSRAGDQGRQGGPADDRGGRHPPGEPGAAGRGGRAGGGVLGAARGTRWGVCAGPRRGRAPPPRLLGRGGPVAVSVARAAIGGGVRGLRDVRGRRGRMGRRPEVGRGARGTARGRAGRRRGGLSPLLARCPASRSGLVLLRCADPVAGGSRRAIPCRTVASAGRVRTGAGRATARAATARPLGAPSVRRRRRSRAGSTGGAAIVRRAAPRSGPSRGSSGGTPPRTPASVAAGVPRCGPMAHRHTAFSASCNTELPGKTRLGPPCQGIARDSTPHTWTTLTHDQSETNGR